MSPPWRVQMHAWAAYYVEVGQCTEAEAADWVAGLVAQAEAAGAHVPPADPGPVAGPASEDVSAAGAGPGGATEPAAEEAMDDAAAGSGSADTKQLPETGLAGVTEVPEAAMPERAPADDGTAQRGTGTALASAGGPELAASGAPPAAAAADPPYRGIPMADAGGGGQAAAGAQPGASAAEIESNSSGMEALGGRATGGQAGGLDAAASSSSLGEWAAATKLAQPNFGKLAGARHCSHVRGLSVWCREECQAPCCTLQRCCEVVAEPQRQQLFSSQNQHFVQAHCRAMGYQSAA